MNLSSQLHRILQCVLLVQGILALGLTAGAATLNVGELENTGTQTGSVPIEFRSSGNVAALQMDVLFNSASYSSSPATQGTLDELFRVDSFLVEPGRLRVVVGAPANTVLADSVVFRIPLTATSAFTSYFPVSLANIILSSPQSASVAAQIAPSVRFTKLADGAKINGKNGIKFSSDALAASGNITKVTYFAGATQLFAATSSPFTYNWKPAKAGSYILKAVATDSSGNTTTKSITVDVYLNSPPVVNYQSYVVTQNKKATFPYSTLLSKASDPDGNKLIISEFDDHSSKGGVLDIAGNTLTYFPKKNYIGKDSFTFAASDEVDGQADGTVGLLVRRPLQTDIAGDSQADLVLIDESGEGSMFLTLKDGKLKKNLKGPKLPAGYQLAAVEDFDQDGKADFLTIESGSGKTTFLFLNGTKAKSSKGGPTIPTGLEIAAADDFDGDGQSDLLIYDPAKNKTSIWYLNKGAKKSTRNGPKLPRGWTVAGTDDFNNDGKPDLCLVDAKNENFEVWYLNNQVRVGKTKSVKLSTGFQLAGVSDFNRDGKPDLLLFNPETGKTAIWRLSDVRVVRKMDGPRIPEGYQIVAPR